MNTRTLGLIAMAGSPFLGIDFIVSGIDQNYQPTALSGLFSLHYMTGWLFSIVALYRFQATGTRPLGKSVLYVQVLFLTLGEIWNVYSIIQPDANTIVFRILDLFWPISNCFMFFTGLAVIAAKKVQGWKRYITFIVGLWFPVCLVIVPLLFGRNQVTLYSTAIYSATAWFLLGYAVYSRAGTKVKINLHQAAPALRATA